MIELEKNEKFLSFKGLDLLDLIVYIENYDLKYRKTLDLKSMVTFGVEIEYERMPELLVRKYIDKNFKHWTSKLDESLIFGGEISSPILHDEEHAWKDLKKICNYLKKRKVVTRNNAGGHIHVGAHILGNDYNNWRKFLKTYAVYEDILFRFLYGDKINPRKSLFEYAHPTSQIILNKIKDIDKTTSLYYIKSKLPRKTRMQSVNFTNVNFDKLDDKVRIKNTVEFRSPNSTTEEVIWQNNINALAKLMIAVTSSNFDEEYIDYKIKTGQTPSAENYYTYNAVMLKKVLEFTDLIFENNLDKIYFLRQYIKEFEEVLNINIAFKAKKFVK